MAKPAKTRKAAARRAVPSSAALRTAVLRAGFAGVALGAGVGLYVFHGRKVEVAVREQRAVAVDARPAAVEATAEKPPPVVEPVAPKPSAVPEPPQRETSRELAKPMSAALKAAFDSWLMGAYAKCWRAPRNVPEGDPYLPKVRVAFKADGALAAPPKLVNPPSDPAWRAHAEAALKAVKGCDPLHVPDKYAEYYPAWRSRTIYFDSARN